MSISPKLLFALTAALLLDSCDAPAGNNSAQAGANASASDHAEEGRVDASGDSPFIYPGSQLSGTGKCFTTGDPLERVIAWYRDPARRSEMIYVSTERQDDGYIALGTAGEEGKPFTMKITTGAGGGTEGQLLPSDWLKGGQKIWSAPEGYC